MSPPFASRRALGGLTFGELSIYTTREIGPREFHHMADGAASSEVLSLAEVEALTAQHFPEGFLTRRGAPSIPLDQLIEDMGPLTIEHIKIAQEYEAAGSPVLGVQRAPLKAIRHTHHRVAQYLSMGMDETRAAKLCNMAPSTVSILKADPAFAELLAYYASNVKEEFADFVSTAADLSMDMLGRLREILEDDPENLSPTQVMEAIKLLADRTGHAPVQKSVNVNVNTDMASRLRAAQARRSQLTFTADISPEDILNGD